MGLEKYNEKRDFTKTKEPKGVKKASKDKLRFVVQKHAASHLHYDFRLEIDGVLVSWAVPKGPSGNPSDKRLAMQTEDHPMGYIDFEGTIPKGEYGGGTVMVWDIGTYHAEGNDNGSKDNSLMKKMLREGNIKVVLDGGKMHGSWHIVMMKKEDDRRQWLLMKGKDEFAGTKVEFDPNSILTGRDFDAIEKGDSVWHSNRSADENVKSLSTTSKKKTPNTKAVDEFTAEDLAEARKIKLFPSEWRPQLATLADEAFDNDEWLFENKFDGYRALAQIDNGQVELISRNGISFNQKYKEVAKALLGVTDNVILDGEIVIEDSKGKSHFQWLQNHDEDPTRGEAELSGAKRGTLKFYVFDILYFNGFDLTQLELIQRKKILKAILPKIKNIVYSEHTIGDGIKAFKSIEKKGGEGVIAKKISSKYYPDKRSKDWLKIKTEMQQEMVIGGFTDPQGSRKGIGALLCGYYKEGKLHYSGKVGSGYTEDILKDLRTKLDKLERKTNPFVGTSDSELAKQNPKMQGIHWVEPKLLAQIKFTEWTETNSMRHPVYLGLREDKPAKKVIAEKPTVKTEAMDETTKTDAKAKGKASDAKSLSDKVEFSNLDKIFWPKEKITKGDVVNYYNDIADYILPYLKDRPESMRRTPDGIKSAGFFQKDVAGKVPKWIKTKKIKSESAEEAVEWLLCQDKDTLLYLANLGCIEMNPWSSRVGSLNNPDYIIFDLDPNKADIQKLVATAKKVKEILDRLKIKAYLKTSGGKGLHVFIPVLPKYTYEQSRDFSLLISQMANRELPEITSLERLPAKRVGKVYLDFLQNGKGKTMASIYSIRPREGAGVSTPLEWDELDDKLDLQKFNIRTLPERLKEKGDLWKDFFKDSMDLKTILSNI
ncbi:MAG TPA: DNA ligase D [Flavobacterium sp.]|nr:DNA ligase D [Flavobacterium sp.]